MDTFTDTDTATDTTEPQPQPTARTARPPLRRAYHGRMLGGVAAGIADYLDVDVTIIRVAFVVFTFLGGGIPAYLAALLLIPEEGTDESIASSLLDSVQHRSW